MAMTSASLVARWKAALGAPATAEGLALQDDILTKLAGAVIDEIKLNGVVSVSVVSNPLGNFFTAPAGGGPCTGTVPSTGTIA